MPWPPKAVTSSTSASVSPISKPRRISSRRLVKALRDGHHGYTPAQGIPELCEAVAADLAARHGAAVDPGQVLILPGGKVTMFFAMLIYGQPGAEIMYPNPGFPIYESAIRFSGATPVPMVLREENGFAFSAAEVLDQITERTR